MVVAELTVFTSSYQRARERHGRRSARHIYLSICFELTQPVSQCVGSHDRLMSPSVRVPSRNGKNIPLKRTQDFLPDPSVGF